MRIEELLNKYFEGESTCEEERELRSFFCKGIVPEHLQMYRPLFGYIEEENREYHSMIEVASIENELIEMASIENELIEVASIENEGVRRFGLRPRVLYTLSGVAAGLLLLLGIAGIHLHVNASPDIYVIIDGKQFTDPEMAREQALVAFQSVCFSEDEVFSTLFDE